MPSIPMMLRCSHMIKRLCCMFVLVQLVIHQVVPCVRAFGNSNRIFSSLEAASSYDTESHDGPEEDGSVYFGDDQGTARFRGTQRVFTERGGGSNCRNYIPGDGEKINEGYTRWSRGTGIFATSAQRKSVDASSSINQFRAGNICVWCDKVGTPPYAHTLTQSAGGGARITVFSCAEPSRINRECQSIALNFPDGVRTMDNSDTLKFRANIIAWCEFPTLVLAKSLVRNNLLFVVWHYYTILYVASNIHLFSFLCFLFHPSELQRSGRRQKRFFDKLLLDAQTQKGTSHPTPH